MASIESYHMIKAIFFIASFLVCEFVDIKQCLSQNEKQSLVGHVEQAIAIFESLEPYDCVGNARELETFNDDVTGEGEFRFRLRSDSVRKEITCTLDSKSILDIRNGAASTHFWQVRDRVVRSSAFEKAYRERKFEKYSEAIGAIEVPFLANCVFAPYPEFGSKSATFQSTLAIILDPVSNVESKVEIDSLVCTLRIRGVSDVLHHFTWKFSKPDGLLLEFKAETQNSEIKSKRFEQKVLWGEFNGRNVPLSITCDSTRVRLKEHPEIKNFGEVGNFQTETVFEWITVNETLLPEPKVDLATVEGIKKYMQH